MSEPKGEYLSAAELAELLRTTTKGIYCKLQRQEVPKAAIIQRCKRGRLLFRRSAIEQWLAKGGGR